MTRDEAKQPQKPQVIYVNVYDDGVSVAHLTKESAAKALDVGGITKKFIEVMDESPGE